MGYRFEFDANHRVFRASFHGRIDDDEMTRYDAHVRQVLAKIHLRAAIVDASAVTKFDVSAATIRFIAASEAEISDQAIPIVMIAPAAHIYGMARMFQILSDQNRPTLTVVRGADEAYAKLGLTNLQFELLFEA